MFLLMKMIQFLLQLKLRLEQHFQHQHFQVQKLKTHIMNLKAKHLQQNGDGQKLQQSLMKVATIKQEW